MENEIEKLKKAYLSTQPPRELVFYGFDEVMKRANDKKSYFFTYRYVGFAVIILLVLTGFAGATFASTPNSLLYPVKITAQNAISQVARSAPKDVKNAVQQFVELKKATPTPSPILPTPTNGIKPTHGLENEDNGKNEKIQTPTIKVNINRTHPDVEGINTSKAQEQDNKNNASNKSTTTSNNSNSTEETDHRDNNSQNQSNNSSEHSNSNSTNRKND